ncbi:MAG: outer membrane protein [Nitratireductor sp.]
MFAKKSHSKKATFCKAISAGVLSSLFCFSSAHAQEGPAPYNWSGLYIGALFSGESADLSGRFYKPSTGFTAPTGLSDVTNASLGGVVGYNMQKGPFVLGFEARWSGSDISGDESFDSGAYKQERKIYDTILLGPRLGVAFDRLHFYGTGGFATAGSRVATAEISIIDGSSNEVQSNNDRIFGNYVGAGVEWAVTQKLILGLQYDRVNLNGEKATWHDDANNLISTDGMNPTLDTIAAKLLLKF